MSTSQAWTTYHFQIPEVLNFTVSTQDAAISDAGAFVIYNAIVNAYADAGFNGQYVDVSRDDMSTTSYTTDYTAQTFS